MRQLSVNRSGQHLASLHQPWCVCEGSLTGESLSRSWSRGLLDPDCCEQLHSARIVKQQPDEELVAKIIEERLPPMLDYLGSQIPADGFRFGEFCMADLCIVRPFINASYAGYEVEDSRWPSLAGLIRRVKEQTHVSRILDKEARAMGFGAAFDFYGAAYRQVRKGTRDGSDLEARAGSHQINWALAEWTITRATHSSRISSTTCTTQRGPRACRAQDVLIYLLWILLWCVLIGLLARFIGKGEPTSAG